MARRLRVAVPAELFRRSTQNGSGRMWHEVLARLPDLCDLRSVNESRPGRFMRGGRADAWLFDGHFGPMDVREPQVIQLHETPWSESETMEMLDPSFVDMVVEPTRRAARAAAAIVCPSESARQQIHMDCQIDLGTIFVAHHGVDHHVFRPGVDGGAELVARHGGRAGVPYILSVASVHPRKNLQALREAVTLLATEGYPHQLVIVGGPAHGRPDWEALNAAALDDMPEAPGRLISVPYGISDGELAALMCGAAAFCLPSLSEGFGLPAVEAMACGAPTVLSNRGALPEIGAGAALMVEPEAGCVADGLRTLLSDPHTSQDVGHACAARAQEFSWDLCAEKWMAAIVAGVTGGTTTR